MNNENNSRLMYAFPAKISNEILSVYYIDTLPGYDASKERFLDDGIFERKLERNFNESSGEFNLNIQYHQNILKLFIRYFDDIDAYNDAMSIIITESNIQDLTIIVDSFIDYIFSQNDNNITNQKIFEFIKSIWQSEDYSNNKFKLEFIEQLNSDRHYNLLYNMDMLECLPDKNKLLEDLKHGNY